ncbi:MAG TPA: Stp1/IreP family PP2C-type Ser/Thr phosphatase [Candidatus Sulfotelmatobacter sp.]|nr:Stp1/IreP family PP2C-type Ser/Thr phosphatase [Candidatus Sulfotelmatobacter sp.]
MTLEIRAATDLGMKRTQNEDSHGCWVPESDTERAQRGLLLVVADGMGGSQAGEVASRLAVQTVIQVYREGGGASPLDDLYRAVEAANHVVHAESVAHPSMSGMGTTCTALVVKGADTYLAHVGDSRAYLAQNGRLRQLSQDHSLVAQLVRDGQLTADQARSDPRRNVVTRSVGVGAHVEIDAQRFDGLLRDGDTLLMCSDGLHGLVTEDELLDVMSSNRLEDGCLRAIALANARGGHDNITIILARARPDSVPQEAQVEVETSGRASSAETDHHRDDVEHTRIITPARRSREDDDDGEAVASRAPRPRDLEEEALPSRRRTMMWLVIALVVLLLAIGAAALVLMQLNKQSTTLGWNDAGRAPAGESAWL